MFENLNVMFDFWKILRKEKKNAKEIFFMFGYHMKNIKENKI